MAGAQDQSSHVDTKTLRMVQLMQQSVRYAEAARRAEAADARSQRALELRTAETASKGAARALRGELQQDANALAHDKHRYQIFQGFLKRYDAAVDAIDKDDKARIAHERAEQQIAVSQSGVERATVGRDRDTASDFKSQIETYSAAAIPAATAAAQSGTFNVEAYNRELRRRLTGPKAPGGGWTGYQSAISQRNGNPALEPALRAYAQNPTAENLNQVVAQHVSATTVTDQPGTQRASRYQPRPYPGTEAAAQARRFIENAEDEYRKGLHAWGVQGAGTPQTTGTPGTPAPKIPESPIVEQILKKALQEGKDPIFPGREAIADYKQAMTGAQPVSYKEADGTTTYTNVPWEVTGEVKPGYMEALKKARPDWLKDKPLARVAKDALKDVPPSAPPTTPSTSSPPGASMLPEVDPFVSLIPVDGRPKELATEGGSPFWIRPSPEAASPSESSASVIEAEVQKVATDDPDTFAHMTEAHWAAAAQKLGVPPQEVMAAVEAVKRSKRPGPAAPSRGSEGGFTVPQFRWR